MFYVLHVHNFVSADIVDAARWLVERSVDIIGRYNLIGQCANNIWPTFLSADTKSAGQD